MVASVSSRACIPSGASANSGGKYILDRPAATTTAASVSCRSPLAPHSLTRSVVTVVLHAKHSDSPAPVCAALSLPTPVDVSEDRIFQDNFLVARSSVGTAAMKRPFFRNQACRTSGTGALQRGFEHGTVLTQM